ncbi:energy-coupling factor ABC transporter ATP-binding protein [Sulfurospirillum barnesii]|uniref:ABC-type cobalt transport system, ATPase component n=1 Tax=Sulfurospirillum barnesii (strain ATCC 700032 / DSM 10660 / SES-3) TaxID=760154 RepID=I3XXB8_SULBS|nr:ABC transporter ATP-binding protein [Sulfurospirillum barnesii]AFL68592.1 ABC-type cobalt transport system, ATPase component [Sulfurospirillum barnesii SES-3]
MSCSVNIKNLSTSRDGVRLYENVTLDVSHKEKIAIIGPNGCGKTTLLEIIAGLRSLEEGTLELFHQPMHSLEDFKSMRHLIGYLFQDSDNQFLAPVVEDDVAFSLLASGVSKEEAKLKTAMMLQDLGIAHLAKKIVYHLSGGEKKLVALAGVLIMEPKLMLLDEPTNGLDQAMQLRLVDILGRIDKSIIIVSHHKAFIESVVEKIYEITPQGVICLPNHATPKYPKDTQGSRD